MTRFCRKGLAIAGLLTFWSLILGCTPQRSNVGSMPVLQVNDHSLSTQEFSDRLARRLKNFDALSAKDPTTLQRTKEEVLRNFILESLIIDFARANGIQVTDSELDQEVNQFRAAYPDDVAFRRVLAEENLSLSAWRDLLRVTLLEHKVFKKISSSLPKPTADEIKKSYEDQKDRFRRKERIYLRQIVTDDLAKATELKDELKKKNFQELATKYSVAPEGKNGGLVGWVEKGSVDIFDKAFLLPVGGVSQVLESPYGFHILKVERKAAAGIANIEEVKPLIEQTLLAQKEQAEFAAWLDRQIRSSRVLRNQEIVRAISVETKKGKE